jgi:hypothetical protein
MAARVVDVLEVVESRHSTANFLPLRSVWLMVVSRVFMNMDRLARPVSWSWWAI